MRKGDSVQVEFVSANPTGPLHVGHGRGAAYGACLANVLAAAGHEVAREFYINDAGRQMDILALSAWLRYLEQRGVSVSFPDDGYRGDYVREIGTALNTAQGAALVRDRAPQAPTDAKDADAALDAMIADAKTLLGDGWHTLFKHALDSMVADQRDDLGSFNVSFDRWFSEQTLHDGGETSAVAKAVGTLQEIGRAHV